MTSRDHAMDSDCEFGGPEDFTLNLEKYMRQTPSPKPKLSRKATVENAEDVESPIRLPVKDLEIRELKAELEATEAGNASIRKALEAERKENEVLRQKLQDAASLHDVLRLIKTVEKENNRLTTINERLQCDKDDLGHKLQEATSNHEMLENEVATLRDSLTAYDNDHSSHQSTLASLKASHQCTINTLKASHKDQLTDIESQYTEQLEDLTSRQTHQLVDLEERHDNEIASIKLAHKNEINSIKADLEKKQQDDIISIRSDLVETHRNEITSIKAGHTEQITSMKEKLAQADRLMRDHDAKREVLVQSLRTRADTLEKDLNTTKSSHDSAITAVRSSCNKNIANMKATLAKADRLMREHDGKRDVQARNLQARIDSLEKELAAAKAKSTSNSSVTSLHSKLAALTKELDATKTKLETANATITTLTREHNALKDDLAAKNTLIAECSQFCEYIEAEQAAETKKLEDAHKAEMAEVEQRWAKKYAKLSKSMDICDNELRRLWGREELGDTTEGGTKPQRYQYEYVNKHGELNAAGRALAARRARKPE